MAAQKMDVSYVARLARLHLTEEEAAAFGSQLGGVLGHIEALSRLDIEGIEPTAHAAPVHNVFRNDVDRPSIPVDEALSNAPQAANGLFITPRIVE